MAGLWDVGSVEDGFSFLSHRELSDGGDRLVNNEGRVTSAA